MQFYYWAMLGSQQYMRGPDVQKNWKLSKFLSIVLIIVSEKNFSLIYDFHLWRQLRVAEEGD